MVIGEFRDDDGLTYDEWRARRDAEQATKNASTLPRPMSLRAIKPATPRLDQDHILRACGRAIGEMEKDLLAKIDAARHVFDEERDRLASLRENHETLVARQVQKNAKALNQAFANEIQDLRNQITFLKRRVEELEAKGSK